MTRRPLIAGNWKMNLGLQEAIDLARSIGAGASTGAEVAVIPPFPWIVPVREALQGTEVRVGAQNVYWEPFGAFTGEVSAPMLAGLCDYILVGHSERRHVFGETDEETSRKVAAVLSAGVRPILCVGETIGEREAGNAEAVVTRQLEAGLATVQAGDVGSLTIAYEPVWAIGTGVAATSGDAQEMCAMIRGWMSARFGAVGEQVRVLYGGSVSPQNAGELLSQPDVDGGLVGGASLKADSFLAIVGASESGR